MKKQLLILLCLVLGVFTQTWAQGNNPYVIHIYEGIYLGYDSKNILAASMLNGQFEMDYVSSAAGPVPRYSRNGKRLFMGTLPLILNIELLQIHILDATVEDNFGFSFTAEQMSLYAGSLLAGYTGIVVDFSKDNIAINSDYFPDENFREYLQRRSYGKDYVLTQDEINGVTNLSVTYEDITSLKGIEYFTALEDLDCYRNQLTSLDVSKNTALRRLRCHDNQLTSLDISKNTALEHLECDNNQLTSLDVSKNAALTWLNCYENQLPKLDVSKNTALTWLSCSGNQLTTLDVSKNTALTVISCSGNQLTTLDVSKNTALEELYCYDNQLTKLDVSKNTALTRLACNRNQLTSLDVSKNTILEELLCDYNQLTSLDVSKNTALAELRCYGNQLTSLDLSKNTVLEDLQCEYNRLTSLVVSPNAPLDEIDCYLNQMKGEDVDAFINSLPNGGGDIYFIDLTEDEEGNEITDKQVATANAKGWGIRAYDYGSWYYYDGISTGINQPELAQPGAQRTYTIDGRRVEGTQKNPGIYVRGGKKVMVK